MPLKSPFCIATSLLSPFIEHVRLLTLTTYLDHIRSFHASTLEEFSYGAQLWAPCDDCLIGSPVWERDMSVDAYADVVVVGGAGGLMLRQGIGFTRVSHAFAGRT